MLDQVYWNVNWNVSVWRHYPLNEWCNVKESQICCGVVFVELFGSVIHFAHVCGLYDQYN